MTRMEKLWKVRPHSATSVQLYHFSLDLRSASLSTEACQIHGKKIDTICIYSIINTVHKFKTYTEGCLYNLNSCLLRFLLTRCNRNRLGNVRKCGGSPWFSVDYKFNKKWSVRKHFKCELAESSLSLKVASPPPHHSTVAGDERDCNVLTQTAALLNSPSCARAQTPPAAHWLELMYFCAHFQSNAHIQWTASRLWGDIQWMWPKKKSIGLDLLTSPLKTHYCSGSFFNNSNYK